MQNIYQSISAIIDDIGAVGKDRVNNGQGWKFRGIDDVMNAIHPLLAKHKVFVVPQELEQARMVVVLFTQSVELSTHSMQRMEAL